MITTKQYAFICEGALIGQQHEAGYTAARLHAKELANQLHKRVLVFEHQGHADPDVTEDEIEQDKLRRWQGEA